MKPTPLSAMLADDLLLDRVGARLDADDELGSMLLAVAHRADTPIPRATLARRVRPHRGLTVLAALGVAVSGATVAAAVELAPSPPDQASGRPHSRSFLPPSLQALVLPFLSGSPFQGRLVLPFGAVPRVPLDGSATALGLPDTALRRAGSLVEPLTVATQEAQLDKQEHEDQQDAQRQKIQAKGTTATGQGSQSAGPGGRRAGRRGRAGRADRRRSRPPQSRSRSRPRPRPRPTWARCRRPTRATARPTGTPTGSPTEPRTDRATAGAGVAPSTGDPTGGTSRTGSVPAMIRLARARRPRARARRRHRRPPWSRDDESDDRRRPPADPDHRQHSDLHRRLGFRRPVALCGGAPRADLSRRRSGQ